MFAGIDHNDVMLAIASRPVPVFRVIGIFRESCLSFSAGYDAGRWWIAAMPLFRIGESEIKIMNATSPRSRRFETLSDAVLTPRFVDDRMLPLMSRILLVLAGSALLALSAQFAFRIPVSPVPVTGQTLVVLLIGMAYGSRLGAATVLAYLVEGGMGLPVFANGTAGWQVIMGPTGGYLVGFVAAAFALGWLAERGAGRGPVSTAIAMAVGTIVIYAFGVSWLGQFIGFDKAVAAGVMPFLYGDALKLVVAAGLMPLAWRAVKALHRDKDAEKGDDTQ